MRLPWRYRLYRSLPRWAKRLWGYDWIEDDRMTGDQRLSIFRSLGPVATVGPRNPQWIEYGRGFGSFASGSSTTLFWAGRNHL